MPFFKKKQERVGRIEELEAHVRNIRRIAAEDPKGAGALQSFLIEDGYWDTAAAAVEAGEKLVPPTMEPHPPLPLNPPPLTPSKPAAVPEAGMVTAQNVDQIAPRTEDEVLLEAELQRYLARIAEETTPDEFSRYNEEDEEPR